MKTVITLLTLLVTLSFTAMAQAQTNENLAPLKTTDTFSNGKIEIYKDPLIATYLSATMPGLGQFYAGKKLRGFMFLAGIATTLGAANAFYEPAKLTLVDYDNTNYGGNGDGVLNVNEIQNWEDNKFESDGFDQLSTTRKVGAITGVVTGVGLYIWNIIDARGQAHDYNRKLTQRKVDLGLQAGPDRAGLALNLHF